MPVLAQNFLMLDSDASALRSTLLADVLRECGPSRRIVRVRVYGESMLPALWPGDLVEIESCLLNDVRPGDIVLALRDDRFFLHRLVAVRGTDGFLLRGDSVPRPDPLFPASSLLGRLTTRNTGRRSGPGFGAKWSRAVGLIFCYCAVARRMALTLHSWNASAHALRDSENTAARGDL
jgi:hypothetical protein